MKSRNHRRVAFFLRGIYLQTRQVDQFRHRLLALAQSCPPRPR